jgi:ATP-dependent helicase/nuclease subunit A
MARLRDAREARARPGYDIVTATTLARSAPAGEEGPPLPDVPLPDPRDGPDPSFRGLSWGIAVHVALDAAARGARGEELRRVARSALLEAERPVEDGEPEELDELVSLVKRVLGSELWERARQAGHRLSEVPFAYHDPGSGSTPDGAAPRVIEGVVDLAFREDAGWVIVDYKTDVGSDPGFPRRQAAYRRQVDLYAGAWEALTGEPVTERVLFYTARPESEELVRW